ncbi:hypothetical protein [Stenotrophomonas sp. PS02298]|uniref:hypothetical protein n=1 Tax=Stenotrophomonas sp. PS02298 TaxID=2991424 RepID=UPI00249A4297|nr:hypothetical protein [Stenotrophomonas sp. PS02298]
MVKFTSVQMGHFIISSFRGTSENSGTAQLRIKDSHDWQPHHGHLRDILQSFNAWATPRHKTALPSDREPQNPDRSCDYTMIRLLLI